MNFELDMIARIVGSAPPTNVKGVSIRGISTDSRNIGPGELFVPLRGMRFDGHDYLIQAVRNGAAACLSEEVIAGLSVPVLLVPDSLRALGDIAAMVRMQLRGPLIAVTGSAGKTTTKEMLGAILQRKSPGLKTAGNFNNLIGLPLTLFKLEKSHCWALLEMGTSMLGEIERLTEIAAPDLGIITNIGPAHLATLKGLDGVSRAKGELFAGLKGGTAIVNLDDERVACLPLANGTRAIHFGLDTRAEVRAEEIRNGAGQLGFRLVLPSGSQNVELKISGRHNLHNALAAAAAAYALEIEAPDIAAGLAEFQPLQGRMNLSPLPCGGQLLDDSYNANPLSMAAALQTLAARSDKGRRVAVLGDMLELGDEGARLHFEIGRKAATQVDLLVTVGALAKEIAAGARDGGLPAEAVLQLPDCETALSEVARLQRPGDQILVKGSRGMALDKLAQVLRCSEENPPTARQGG